MVERYLELNEHVENLINDVKFRAKFKDYLLNDQEKTLLNDSIELLSCFQNATETLPGSKYCTISFVMPIVQSILQHLTLEEGDSNIKVTLKSLFTKSAEFYLKKYDLIENETLITTTFLDPRMKKFIQYNEKLRHQFKNIAKKKLREFVRNNNIDKNFIVLDSPIKKRAKFNVNIFLRNIYFHLIVK